MFLDQGFVIQKIEKNKNGTTKPLDNPSNPSEIKGNDWYFNYNFLRYVAQAAEKNRGTMDDLLTTATNHEIPGTGCVIIFVTLGPEHEQETDTLSLQQSKF
jgi:hypothetical protein